jgi:hypothetical protein
MRRDWRPSFNVGLVATVGLLLSATIIALQWPALQPAADDPELLNWARTNHQAGPDWGPLYVLVHRLAYLVSGDTLTGFRIVISGVSLISSSLIFFWIRKCSGSFKLAAAVALLYLVSGFSPAASSTHQSDLLTESSLAGHMALCFVLSALIASPSLTSPPSLAVCSGSLLLATYCRPEFFPAAALCLGAAIVSVVRRRIEPGDMAWIAPLASVWAGLVVVWGVPLPSEGRAFMAFGQHAGLSFCVAYHAFCVTNLWSDWPSYVNRLFPGATSIWTALEVNPLAFGEHLVRNVALSIINLGTGLLDFDGLPAPIGIKRLVAAGFVLWSAAGLWRRKFTAGRVQQLPVARLNATLLAVAAAIILPEMVNWTLLYPRAHYMIVPIAVGLGLLLNLYSARGRNIRVVDPSTGTYHDAAMSVRKPSSASGQQVPDIMAGH